MHSKVELFQGPPSFYHTYHIFIYLFVQFVVSVWLFSCLIRWSVIYVLSPPTNPTNPFKFTELRSSFYFSSFTFYLSFSVVNLIYQWTWSLLSSPLPLPLLFPFVCLFVFFIFLSSSFLSFPFPPPVFGSQFSISLSLFQVLSFSSFSLMVNGWIGYFPPIPD